MQNADRHGERLLEAVEYQDVLMVGTGPGQADERRDQQRDSRCRHAQPGAQDGGKALAGATAAREWPGEQTALRRHVAPQRLFRRHSPQHPHQQQGAVQDKRIAGCNGPPDMAVHEQPSDLWNSLQQVSRIGAFHIKTPR